jgi:hypothetical protein
MNKQELIEKLCDIIFYVNHSSCMKLTQKGAYKVILKSQEYGRLEITKYFYATTQPHIRCYNGVEEYNLFLEKDEFKRYVE